MIFLAEKSELVQKFIERGMHVTPEALRFMRETPESSVKRVLEDLEKREDRPSIVTDNIVSQILESEEAIPSSGTTVSSDSETKPKEREAETTKYSPAREEKGPQEDTLEEEIGFSEEEEDEIVVIQDITGESTSKGEVEDFVQLFNDRFERLANILRSREGFQNCTELENVPRHEGDVVNLVGLVNEKRQTRKQDAWIVEIEDLTGKAVIYVKDSERNEEVIEKIERVVTDEVIGVKAKVPDELRSGNRNPLVWGNEIVWPDIPLSSSSSRSQPESQDASGYAVLISDLHVGSSMFLEDVFDKFLGWLNGKAGNQNQRKLADQVKYLIIAGDLVDGIGVYPGQQKELEIDNIRDQYEKVAELLSGVPDDIEIIISPGNHDAVRLAEPQPALLNEVSAPLRRLNPKLVGNPALISIEGVKFLIYHGMGFDDLISAVSDLDRENVARSMKEFMKRRHLAPIYGEPMGGRTPIAPEEKDYLLIDEVPDVFHCGHLHRYDCEEYRGVLMVNSATFQEQTIFMKRQGVVPTPGYVPIVNLKTKEAKAINFA